MNDLFVFTFVFAPLQCTEVSSSIATTSAADSTFGTHCSLQVYDGFSNGSHTFFFSITLFLQKLYDRHMNVFSNPPP